MNEEGAAIAELKKVLIDYNNEINNIDQTIGDSVRILLEIAAVINQDSDLGRGLKNMAYRTANLEVRSKEKLDMLSSFMNDRITTAENNIIQSSTELSDLSSRLNSIDFESLGESEKPITLSTEPQTDINTSSGSTPIEAITKLEPEQATGSITEGTDVSNQIPKGDTSFHSWMSYDAITNQKSGQWKLQNDPNTFTDENGIRRYSHPGNPEGDTVVALGTGFGDQIGTRYKITTDEGNSYYAILGDNKNPSDSNAVKNSSGESIGHRSGNGQISVVEFVIDKHSLDSAAKQAGSVGAIPDYKGNITSVEKLDTIEGFNWG